MNLKQNIAVAAFAAFFIWIQLFSPLAVILHRHKVQHQVIQLAERQLLEHLFLPEIEYLKPSIGDEVDINSCRYDIKEVHPTAGGWVILAINDLKEKHLKQTLRHPASERDKQNSTDTPHDWIVQKTVISFPAPTDNQLDAGYASELPVLFFAPNSPPPEV